VTVFEGLNGPYSTIVADPPWSYRTQSPTTKARTRMSANNKYSTLNNNAIKDLPVSSLAAKDAHCYIWTTNPHLYGDSNRGHASPIEVMEAWGFRYVTLLTWLKEGTMGMGFYFRGETEHVLFGVRGNAPIPPADRERNWFAAKKTGHSQKPASFFDIVERVSPGPRLELFARQPRLGWDHWGKGFESTKGTAA